MAGYLIGGRLVAGGGLDAGQITVRAIPAASLSFELPLNSDGTIDANLPLPMVDPVTQAVLDIPNLLLPGRDFIGWVENGKVLEAGPIWGDPFTFPSVDRVVANGLWSYFEHRYVLPVLSPGQMPQDVTSQWSGLSLRTIAKRIVQQACSHPNAGLPIDFESDFPESPGHEREYPGSDMKTVAEALTELTEVEGGPDITFRPKWGSDRKHIRWDMLTGDPDLHQGGEPHYWDVSVPDAYARVDTLERDGTSLATRMFVTGATFQNMVPDHSAEGDTSTFQPANATLDRNDTSWAAAGTRSLNLYAPTTADSYMDLDSGAPMGFGMQPGKTYTFSATACPKLAPITGDLAPDGSDAGGGANLSRTRSLVVHAVSPSLGLLIWHSPQAANIVDQPSRVSVTFSLPADTTDAFLRAYHGGTSGEIRWDAFSLTQSTEPVPYNGEESQIQALAESTALTDAGYPLLEGWDNRASVVRQTTLQQYANEGVARGADHIETFSLVIQRDKEPVLGTYWPGDYARLRIGKNPRVPAGTYVVRIIAVRFGKGGDVTVDCAPERVASGYPVPPSKRRWLRAQLTSLSTRLNESNRG